NYFYIKSLLRAITIAKLIGREDDVPELERRTSERKTAIISAYYNSWDGNFVGNLQGANAFAVDIGLGDDRTYKNLVSRYKALGRYDTGIFGTDVVTRVLFEHGDGRTALGLLLSGHPTSFDGMRRAGATTLWEYWPGSLRDRSHNHPMFGAVSAYLYDYLLGIRAKDGSAAYREVEIAPVLADGLDRVCGWRMLPGGKISVSMEKDSEKVSFAVTIPPTQSAVFSFGGKNYPLSPGENLFSFPLESPVWVLKEANPKLKRASLAPTCRRTLFSVPQIPPKAVFFQIPLCFPGKPECRTRGKNRKARSLPDKPRILPQTQAAFCP
ncbi:MAG: alpha-L-rhamnosidase C-terminal domain-containing protein, partial [Eubacteriales bacterium]